MNTEFTSPTPTTNSVNPIKPNIITSNGIGKNSGDR